MKIINIITGSDNGGGGEYVLNICSSKYYKSELICIGEGELRSKAQNRNIQVEIFNIIDFINGNFVNYIAEKKVDLILWHGAKAFFIHKLIKNQIDIKSFAVIHSDFKKDFINENILKNKLLTELSYIGLKSFSNFIAVSEIISDKIKKCFSYNELYIIRNAIDINIRNSNELITRESAGVNKDDFLFINIARLHPIKNHINLINAFKMLHLKYSYSKLIIIGEGSERKKIEEYIEKNNLRDSILLLGEKERAYRYFNIADVNILTSISEGGEPPIVLLEGGVFEVVPIFPNIGYLGDIIDGNMGYKINPFNIEDIYLTMEKCIIDKKNNEKAKEFNRFIVNNHSLDKFHKKFNDILSIEE